jgi:hypothetical protein
MTTATVSRTDADFGALAVRGTEIYEQRLRSKLEPAHNGKTVAIHLDTGDFAVAVNSPSALRSLRKKQPSGMVMTMIVGPEREDPTLDRMLARHLPATETAQ